MANLIAGDGLPARKSGIWAKEKLYYLERYLDIFSVGMQKRWSGNLYYVDLFSGPGVCVIPETAEEFDGSPLIALKFNFAKYFFFEADLDCFSALKSRVESRSPEKLRQIELIQGDCNEQIDSIKFPPSNSLGTAFIDPTGIAPLPFKTIQRLATGRKIDLIINFHEGMGVRMNLHQYNKTDENALMSFLSSDRWKMRIKSGPLSLDKTCQLIAEEYLENLKGLGYLASDSDKIPIKSRGDVLLYYLLFASKHPRGTEFWHKIKLIDSRGQRSFPEFQC
jgi:three-Cys-motif partner protein